MLINILSKERIKAGETLIRRGDASNMRIEAALWFYSQEQNTWKLMLSIKGVERQGPKYFYNKIQKLLKGSEINEHISLSEIVLVKYNSSLLNLLRSAVKTGPGINGIRFTGNVINGQLIPDAYIYRLK